MKVNRLELPAALQAALVSGIWTNRGKDYSGRWTDKRHLALFKALFPRIDNPLPQLFDYEGMVQENTLWFSEERKFYVGTPSNDYPPGNIDPHKTVIIGDSEPDSLDRSLVGASSVVRELPPGSTQPARRSRARRLPGPRPGGRGVAAQASLH